MLVLLLLMLLLLLLLLQLGWRRCRRGWWQLLLVLLKLLLLLLPQFIELSLQSRHLLLQSSLLGLMDSVASMFCEPKPTAAESCAWAGPTHALALPALALVDGIRKTRSLALELNIALQS